MLRWYRFLSVASWFAWVCLVASGAAAEGSEQTGSDELMTNESAGETVLFVDVLPGDGFLNIAARAGDLAEFDVRVTDPDGVAEVHTLSDGAGRLPPAMPGMINDPLRVDVSGAPGVWEIQFLVDEIYPYDISVTETADNVDPTAVPVGGGRLFSNAWHISGQLPNTSGLVLDQTYFVRSPVGVSSEYIWRLDLGGLAGGFMCVVANDLGLPGDLARSSQTLATLNAATGATAAARDYCDDLAQYPLYLNAPNSRGPQPSAPTLTFSGFGGCGAVLEGAGGTFEFETDLPGTYEIIIDTDRNGYDADDVILSGAATAGANAVVWDGLNRAGNPVPASATEYDARISVRVGEFHFTAIDVEATDPGVSVVLVAPGDLSETNTLMYWDDRAIIGTNTNNVPDPAVTVPDGVSSATNSHDWGDALTGNNGVGNDAFIDTWVFGAQDTEQLSFLVRDPADDVDGDGVINGVECALGDTDGDGTPNVFDPDDDGDGILTIDEDVDGNDDPTDDNTDGDDVPNYLDTDDDGDGILTIDEDVDGNDDPTDDDSDGDDVPNYLDADDDGDGVPTADEDIDGDDDPTNDDTDGDDIPNYLDTDDDGDGILTIDEDVDGNDDPTDDNTDGDDVPNYLDPDDDGDGIPTIDEDVDGNDDPTNDDTDGDDVPNYLDPDDDGDGVPTIDEDVDGDTDPTNDDTDGDDVPNYLDPDDDGDGIPTIDEDVDGDTDPTNDDTDGDDNPNYLDPDDDGDGIPTTQEIADAGDDVDFDDDGDVNWLDPDSDGDGISDAAENTGDGDLNNDGVPDYLDPENAPADTDNDGIPDEVECAGDVDDCVDSDGDGSPDNLDPDDDDDGIPTMDERPDASDVDSDDDGTPDYLDPDDDGDGVPTATERPDDEDVDTDEDGTPDYLDTDDDGDGVPTTTERPGDEDVDTDDDGTPDYLDPDDDGDGLSTTSERPDDEDVDTDEDGIPDYLDPDDDDDGVPTTTERPDGEDVDTDDDGTPDYLDPDDDGDGLTTEEERPGDEDVDSDADGIPDYLDADDDASDAGVDAGVPPPDVEPEAGVPEPEPTDVVTDVTTEETEEPPATDEETDVAMETEETDEETADPSFERSLEGGGCGCTVPGSQSSGRSAPWALLAALVAAVVIRRRRSRASSAVLRRRSDASSRTPWMLLLVVFAASLPRPALAQSNEGIALNRYEPSERGSDWFQGESLDLRGEGRWSVGAVGDWAFKPLVVYDGNGDVVQAIIKHQAFVHLGASVVLWDRVRFGLNLPILAYQDGSNARVNGVTYTAADGAALGDVRLGADVCLFGEYGDPATMALGAQFHLPTGSRDSFTSDGKVRITPRALLAGDVANFAYSARVSSALRTQTDNFAGEPFGADLQFGASAGLRFSDDEWLVGPELWGSTVVSDSGDGAFEKRTTPFEGVLGVHYFSGPWRFGAGFGPGMTRGLGAPKVRSLVSVEWSEEVEQPLPPSDTDGDGIYDEDDACPDLAGEPNEDPSKHGCPPPPPPQDTDGDGIFDEDDACVETPGEANDDPKLNGCPPADTDGDGILDEDDACATEPGIASSDPAKHGCPPPQDTDGDGIFDEDDACPKEAGKPNEDPKQHGCPRAQITGKQIIILDRIEFDTGKATIRSDSTPILEAVRQILEENKQIEQLRVEGHTDNRGSAQLNARLSAERAAAVVEWLVEHGIDRSRLVSAGFGPQRPMETNDTEEGRQANRRVEFHIVKSDKK